MPLRLIPELHRATHQIGLYIGRFDDPRLTQAEAHILAHLAAHGESTVAELHRALAHRRSTLTSVLDRLVDAGLVTRDVHEHDRRSFLVRLTRFGKVVAARVLERLEALETRALARLPRQAVQDLLRVLAALAQSAHESRPAKSR